MDNFSKYIDRILGHEGGYSNRSPDADPGGETKWGISKRSYPNLDIKNLERWQAIEIYRRDFWTPVASLTPDPVLQYQLLDTAVNSGMGNATRMLQRAIGVADDGHFGPQSQAKLRYMDREDTALLFLAERLEWMTKLSNWAHNSRGWARRIAENLRYVAEDN